MGGIISKVEKGSIADYLGWRQGDEIISINGIELQDIIDYRYNSTDENLDIVLQSGSETFSFEIEKDIDEPLGVEFVDELFDGVRVCGANCIFCFVEQLPKGLRKSLYLKDDDYRLSFLHGNFVTLANTTLRDLHRIVEQRLSPMYISVHTTNHILREKILGRKAQPILEQIDFLASGRIEMHTQIVLCRGINDGEYLERFPYVKSIAVVPAGISKHRRNKVPLQSLDIQYSRDILDIVKHYQKKFIAEKGTRLVWAADEFYISAGKRIPNSTAYEGFPQIENGVWSVNLRIAQFMQKRYLEVCFMSQ